MVLNTTTIPNPAYHYCMHRAAQFPMTPRDHDQPHTSAKPRAHAHKSHANPHAHGPQPGAHTPPARFRAHHQRRAARSSCTQNNTPGQEAVSRSAGRPRRLLPPPLPTSQPSSCSSSCCGQAISNSACCAMMANLAASTGLWKARMNESWRRLVVGLVGDWLVGGSNPIG